MKQHAEIIARLKSHWILKILLGLGLAAMFAVLYLLPQRYPVFPATAMKPLWIDRMIPFVPDSVYLYESLYFLMPIAPWLMTSEQELTRYSKGLLLMSLVGFCFFFYFPTLSPRPQDVQDVNLLYRMLTRIDNDYNAFPSLHVAYAVFHSACCHALSLSRNIQESGRGGTRPSTTCECRGFSTRGGTASTPSESISTGSSSSSGTARKLVPWVFWGWTLGIAVSTLLTKQHVFVDVIAGAVLGLGSYRICCQPLKMPWAHRRHA